MCIRDSICIDQFSERCLHKSSAEFMETFSSSEIFFKEMILSENVLFNLILLKMSSTADYTPAEIKILLFLTRIDIIETSYRTQMKIKNKLLLEILS